MPKDDCFGMLYVVGVLSIALEVTNEIGFGTEFDSVVLGSDELTEGSSLDLSTKSCIVSLCAGTNETIISLSKGFPPESATSCWSILSHVASRHWLPWQHPAESIRPGHSN